MKYRYYHMERRTEYNFSKKHIYGKINDYIDLLENPKLSDNKRSIIYEQISEFYLQFGNIQKSSLFLDYAIFADPTSESLYRKKIELYNPELLPNKLLSVVIPTFNRCNDLVQCVNNIRRNSVFPIQIVAVCDKSDDGTVDFILEQNEKEDFLGIINDTRLGCILSTKVGFIAAQGDYIALLNDDVKVMPGWDLEAILTIDEDATAACAAPLVIYPNGTAQFVGQHSELQSKKHAWIGNVPAFNHSHVYGQKLLSLENFLHTRECNYAWFPIIKKECLKQIGYYDDNYRHYYADVDIGYLFQQHGWQNIFCPTSIIVHYHKSAEELSSVELHQKGLPDKRYFIKKWGITTPIDAF
ncbi:hypothetical protein DSCO28_03210 [Desulfosarcina ovata subsp. sediminis]|uniref:Glycosyltransferase 2-like domain-containing protein n=1 Tax=Desulfosarcina ovata subsp. sediminis TaxID=885957 RepID=A0A5K7ZHL2_9BACT|nr:glycosyltransferase family 2 protein [Desulfosarcina ovata]BBO79755.1 hypothetical protein DSCO28_03210 [Desulfosarcina ovata subsp. sediminis]